MTAELTPLYLVATVIVLPASLVGVALTAHPAVAASLAVGAIVVQFALLRGAL